MRPTRAEIDLDAFLYNMGQVSGFLRPGVELMAVLKADGYGHGAVPLARVAQREGVRAFGVACVEEALELRRNGIRSRVLVLGAVGEGDLDEVLESGISVALFSPRIAARLDEKARAAAKKVAVHVKIDTGMRRLGLSPEDAGDFFDRLGGLKNLHIEGVFTHLADADGEDAEFTDHQIEVFSRLLADLRRKGASFEMAHAANSAAIMGHPGSHFDLVRPGIALYGSNPVPRRNSPAVLKGVMSLKTEIVHIQRLPRGRSVGYGRTFRAKRDSVVATVPAGYGDGYSRALSNKAQALVRGERAAVIGAVCMDMTMLDVTDVPGASVGDEVILLGSQGKQTVTAEELAALAGTIPYEVYCQIGRRVPRKYVWPDRVKVGSACDQASGS